MLQWLRRPKAALDCFRGFPVPASDAPPPADAPASDPGPGPAGVTFERAGDRVLAVGRDGRGRLVLMEEMSPEAADWLGHHLISLAFVASAGRTAEPRRR